MGELWHGCIVSGMKFVDGVALSGLLWVHCVVESMGAYVV